MTTAGQQLMTVRTEGDSVLIAHEFEVSDNSCQPDVLIMAAGNLTTNGCRVVLDDDGSYVENKKTGQRFTVTKQNNIYEFMVEVLGDDNGANKTQVHEKAMVLPIEAADAVDDGAVRMDIKRLVRCTTARRLDDRRLRR